MRKPFRSDLCREHDGEVARKLHVYELHGAENDNPSRVADPGLTRIDLTALTGLTCLGTSATSCTATSSVYLFDACADLEEVILPASVKKIGAYVFRDCASLENVVMDGVELIGKQAFMNTGLKNLALPGTMKQFGDDAFRNCANLQTIAINSNVTSYGKYVFAECPLLAEVTIGGGATKLGDYMFYGCAALKTATLPGTVTYLGRYTFQGSGLTEIDLSALTQLTCFGTSATSCSTSAVSYVFADCKDLTRVVLPDSLTKIGGYAFYGCESLTDINLGNVVQFNDFALAGTSIGSVTLSSALTHVGAGVFAGCANVEEIAVRAGSTGYRSVSGVLYDEDNAIVAYPSGKVPEGGILTIAADMGVGEGAFAGCTGISEVIIEEGITVIGDYAFYDSAVKKVTLPSTLTEIGQYAFAYSDVAEIALPSTLTEIGQYAFAYSALKSVTVPESVSTMGEYAFAYSMLESATLQGSYFVTHMFDGCGQLSQVTIAEGATSIAAYMFQDCYSLTEISIPESVTNISTYSFAGSGLKNFVVEERFEWVGDYAFANSALESVTICEQRARVCHNQARYVHFRHVRKAGIEIRVQRLCEADFRHDCGRGYEDYFFRVRKLRGIEERLRSRRGRRRSRRRGEDDFPRKPYGDRDERVQERQFVGNRRLCELYGVEERGIARDDRRHSGYVV